MRATVFSCGVVLAAALVLVGPGTAGSSVLEILGQARVNNRTDLVTFKIAPSQAHASALRIRSGSLAVTLAAVEIEFTDGTHHRLMTQETLPPGHQSAAIAFRPGRAMARVLVSKKPGLRDGETMLQLLGTVEKPSAR
ncbi:hypothetical protein [Hyphomicrobium sp.]|uniref:hypothetical protein n=1 Tax=Hyphomicrobium sp. TaxID=82 RepID=UPI003F729C6F